ncbi:MAG: hypothetical protein AAGF56_13330, partial [Pseudomonadota bacterium]
GALLRGSIQLAYFAVASDGSIRWIMRQGAAQAGGGLPRRPVLPRLGQGPTPRAFDSKSGAMMEQLIAWRAENPGDVIPPDMFQIIPPAAVIPAPGGAVPQVFPDSYDHVIAPLPESEITAVLRRAEAMAPFDLSNARDEVTWHIVVPDVHYEPDLLVTPQVSPLFDQAVASFRGDVGAQLRRRQLLRQQVSDVQARIDSESVTDFGVDDDPIPGEAGFPVVGTITVPRYDLDARTQIDDWRSGLNDDLFTADQLALLTAAAGSDTTRRGIVPFQQAIIDALKPANDLVDFGFTRVQADIYRIRQIMLDNEESTKLATFPILAGIAQGTNAVAMNRNIKDYFAATQAQTSLAITNALSVDRADMPGDGDGDSFGNASRAALNVPSFRLAPDEEPETMILATFRGNAGFGASSGDVLRSTVSHPSLNLNLSSTSQTPTTAAGLVVQNFLPNSYLQGNAFAGFFDDGRQTAVEDFALKTLEDRQAGIKYADAIPGAFEDLRTVTIADRLANSIAMAARTSALRLKSDAIAAVQGLDISLTDLTAPIVSLNAGYFAVPRQAFLNAVSAADSSPQERAFVEAAMTPVASATDVEFAMFDYDQAARALGSDGFGTTLRDIKDTFISQQTPVSIKELALAALQGRLDPMLPNSTDESTYLTSAVAILESVITLYRAVEGRIAGL